MPYLYENSKTNFTNFDHFKEVAVKTINEIYGRVNPLDVFDFDETKDTYKCVAYYDHETPPDVTTRAEEQKARDNEEANRQKAEAEALEAVARIVEIVRSGKTLTDEDQQIAIALGEEPFAELKAEMQSRFAALEDAFKAELNPLNTNDEGFSTFALVRDNETIEEGTLAELEEKAKVVNDTPPADEKQFTEHDVFKATDDALALAKEHNIDLKLVTGTGANGNIKKSDVAAYIKATGSNPAPVTENANGSNEQPNA